MPITKLPLPCAGARDHISETASSAPTVPKPSWLIEKVGVRNYLQAQMGTPKS